MKMLHLVLLLPFLGLLWPPFYDRIDPVLLGFPFFYWYQLAWVPATSLLIWLVWKRGTR
ncbi:conserved hypothetical protein [Gluconacetobacter diazotrophicus PA1 5]|uniref:DUF3311 domain-containing protein n=2 Tax=Gluconacetobacter diazotrophicus TaxID=33996 RepID=A0A7W4I487_GLUDI|nr:DUF3311 domain-containing protein [Gluconacetobacter diazotrophicus]ACI51785.1 conserved hypothetical protein [Gluconacetobacter diazotrophicus PA1 5]MBB2155659.1 DUF3311 domain-containing protein [Gluconacetobacter diazotrophicus]TWB11129.1 uncharacterized protein DUF3311 [Gluconacetobacter diazotrophicus]